MVGKIRNLIKNPIFTGLFIVSSANIIGTFLSYYFNFLTQSLFPNFQDFGDFIFIITFLTVVMLVPNSVSGTLNLIVTELKVKNEFAKLTLLYIRMLVLFSLVGLTIGFFIFVTAQQLSEVFNIRNIFYIQLLGVLVFLTTANTPLISFLYGLLKFKSYSVVIVGNSLIKILFTLYFYNSGYGFSSILYGFILGTFLSFIIGNILLISSFDPRYKFNNVSEYTKRIILFSLPMFFIGIGSSFLGQLDFLIVKSKFDSLVSGMYGYLVNLGKIFYFGSLIFCGAMAPQITESFNKKENYFKIMFFYLKIVGFFVGSGFIVLAVFTKQFLDFFVFISSYIGLKSDSLSYFYYVIEYIPLYTIFIAIYILINFFTIFLVATSTLKIYVSYVVAVALQSVLIFTYANDINTTIYCNILVSSLFLVYLIYEIYKRHASFNNSSNL